MASARITDDAAPRVPIDRIGSRVLQDLVEMVVTGAIVAGEYLPPEQALCDEFGVSRTVIRETIKRMQEKGLVSVAQGRGTKVRSFTDWNVLDPLVFDALVRHDESLGVLDEVSIVRAALEGVMAGEVAAGRETADLEHLRGHLDQMVAETDGDIAVFLEADLNFHLAVMASARNQIAGTIARSLYVRARQSSRWDGVMSADHVAQTVVEHTAIFDAIERGDAASARTAMEEHILSSWRRRRLSDGVHRLNP